MFSIGRLPSINNSTKLEVRHREDGKKCYFDPYRNTLVVATAEEAVRQKTARYFEALLGVPNDCIRIEDQLTHYSKDAIGRADITIFKRTPSGGYIPLAVVECKAPTIPYTDTALGQVANYAKLLKVEYIFLTNGEYLKAYKMDTTMGSPVLLETIPKYQDMLISKGIPSKRVSFPSIRPSLEDYSNKDFLEDRWWEYGGEDTPWELQGPISNYYDALIMDKDHLLPSIEWGFFSVVEDRGVVDLNNMNRSGEGYPGNYRSFLVKLHDGTSRIVNLSIFGVDPGFEDRGRGYTSLIVSTNIKTSSHNILQLNVDDFAELSKGTLTIRHNGRISSLKSKDLMDFIRRQNTKLEVDQNQCILLGSLPISKLYRLNDPDVYELTCNLIEYGLLREKFRETMKKRRRTRTPRKSTQ